eukprot:1042650-Prymnesium_polylepis.1
MLRARRPAPSRDTRRGDSGGATRRGRPRLKTQHRSSSTPRGSSRVRARSGRAWTQLRRARARPAPSGTQTVPARGPGATGSPRRSDRRGHACRATSCYCSALLPSPSAANACCLPKTASRDRR